METKYKISIPEPCHQDWNKMTANQNGKFCSVCVKSVIDFTNKSETEIKEYLIQNRDHKICGRFKKSQLNSLIIQIPSHILHSKVKSHKIFLLALFIVMGTTLFSCADKNGNKQKIDKIEIVKQNKVDINRITVGDIKLNSTDSLQNNIPLPPPPSIEQIKFVKPKKQSKIICPQTKKGEVESKKEIIIEDEIYNGGIAFIVEPEYSGGTKKFYDYFKNEFKFPSEVIDKTGEIQVSFVIDKNGSLVNIKSIKDFDLQIKEEVLRILKHSNKWQPGEQNGKKTITRNLLSIQIQGDTINKINLSKY